MTVTRTQNIEKPMLKSKYSDTRRIWGFQHRDATIINDTYFYFSTKAKTESILLNQSEAEERLIVEHTWLLFWKVFYEKNGFQLSQRIKEEGGLYHFFITQLAFILNNSPVERSWEEVNLPYFDYEMLYGYPEIDKKITTNTVSAFNRLLINMSTVLYDSIRYEIKEDLLQDAWIKFCKIFNDGKQYKTIEINKKNYSVFKFFKHILTNLRKSKHQEEIKKVFHTPNQKENLFEGLVNNLPPESALIAKDLDKLLENEMDTKIYFLLKYSGFEKWGWEAIYQLWNETFKDDQVEYTSTKRTLQVRLDRYIDKYWTWLK